MSSSPLVLSFAAQTSTYKEPIKLGLSLILSCPPGVTNQMKHFYRCLFKKNLYDMSGSSMAIVLGTSR